MTTITATPDPDESITRVMRREMPWWDRDGSEVEPLPEPRFDVAAVFVLIVLAAVALGALVGVHLL